MAVLAKIWLSLIVASMALFGRVSGVVTDGRGALMRRASLNKETTPKSIGRSENRASENAEIVVGSNANINNTFGDIPDSQGAKPSQQTLGILETCPAVEAPENGQVGDCTTMLNARETCQPSCNAGYVLTGGKKGKTRCTDKGNLIRATCKAIKEDQGGPVSEDEAEAQDSEEPEEIACESFTCEEGYSMSLLTCPGDNTTYCAELCCDDSPMPPAREDFTCSTYSRAMTVGYPDQCPCEAATCTKTWSCMNEHKGKASAVTQEACNRVEAAWQSGGQTEASVDDETCCKQMLSECSGWQTDCFDLLGKTFNFFPKTSYCHNGGELPGCNPLPEGPLLQAVMGNKSSIMQSADGEGSNDSFGQAASLMGRQTSVARKAKVGSALDETLDQKCAM